MKKLNYNHIIRLSLCSFILSCSLFTYLSCSKYISNRNLGRAFVNTLYNTSDVNLLKTKHTEDLLNVVVPEIANRVSLEENPNRLQYTYYNMEGKSIKPNYMISTDTFVQFTVKVNGMDDGIIRCIWFDCDRGKISKFSEAVLNPFKTDNVEMVK